MSILQITDRDIPDYAQSVAGAIPRYRRAANHPNIVIRVLAVVYDA